MGIRIELRELVQGWVLTDGLSVLAESTIRNSDIILTKTRLDVIADYAYVHLHGNEMFLTFGPETIRRRIYIMKIWSKPAVREQEVGLEVTSYLPAEIDVI
jgi:coenzyme PQQ precursor peptide PqqA